VRLNCGKYRKFKQLDESSRRFLKFFKKAAGREFSQTKGGRLMFEEIAMLRCIGGFADDYHREQREKKPKEQGSPKNTPSSRLREIAQELMRIADQLEKE
jgi:hypothetical protein